MDGPVLLAALDALPAGRGLRVCRAGWDLALFRVGDAVYAVDDACPHAGGSLANGRLDGTRVRCPVHGLCFDLDGPHPQSKPTLPVRRHAVRVVEGRVWLDTEGTGGSR